MTDVAGIRFNQLNKEASEFFNFFLTHTADHPKHPASFELSSWELPS